MPLDAKNIQPPAARLLTLCLAHNWRDRWPEIVETARQEIEWPALLSMAREHGISGLVAAQISMLSAEGAAPAAIAGAFKADALQVTAGSLRFQSIVETVVSESSAEGIQLVVLKGLALANSLYSEPHLRQSTDIDILCREQDYSRLSDILISLGYRAEDGRNLPGRCSHLETTFEQHFIVPGSNVLIEVHIDSIKLGVRPVNAGLVIDRAAPVRIGETTALSMSPRDLALMLPVHLHRHGFNRLVWFKDIDLLVRKHRDDIDWDGVVSDAEKEGASSSLWLTFSFLKPLFDTPVPDSVLKDLRPSLLTRMAWRRIWPEKDVMELEGITRRRAVQFSVDESWRGMLPSLFLMGRRREKLRILSNRLFRRPRKSTAEAHASHGGSNTSH